MTYKLIDTHTKSLIKIYKDRKVAQRAADKKNLAYGAERFVVYFQ